MEHSRALQSANWRTKAALPTFTTSRNAQRISQEDLRWTRPDRKHARDEEKREVAEGTRVYVGNLPYMAQARDVEQLFAAAGLDIINIDISLDRFTNRNPSYCFVDLGSADAASSAMEKLSRSLLLGRPVNVKPCVQKRNKGVLPTQQSQALSSERWHSTHSTLPTTSEKVAVRDTSLLRPQYERRRVVLSGLPKPRDQHTSDREIRALFKGFRVEAVSKVKSPTSRSTSNEFYAFVDVQTAEEAQRAIKEIDGLQIWGGGLGVRLARKVPEKVFERDLWEGEEEVLRTLRGRDERSNGTEM